MNHCRRGTSRQDLLPQNLLLSWDLDSLTNDTWVSVIDWECTCIGDPAYDLSIVTRGSRKLLGVANSRALFFDAYRAAGGREVAEQDVRVHELLLILGWLNDAFLEYRKPHPSGQGPEHYEQRLESFLSRPP